MTPTHSLMALAALSKRGDRRRNVSVLAGSLIPDAAIFLWTPYQSIVNGVSGEEMWDKLYFEPPMQNLIAWFNSIPIFAGLGLIGFAARGKTWGKLLLVFALAGLIHIAGDLRPRMRRYFVDALYSPLGAHRSGRRRVILHRGPSRLSFRGLRARHANPQHRRYFRDNRAAARPRPGNENAGPCDIRPAYNRSKTSPITS